MVGKQGKCIGVDMTEPMLARARENAVRSNTGCSLRERERERERETDRQRDRETERETERQRDRETETERRELREWNLQGWRSPSPSTHMSDAYSFRKRWMLQTIPNSSWRR